MENSLKKYFTWILSFIFVAAGTSKIFSPDNTGDILIFIFEIDYQTSLLIVYSIATIEIVLGISLYIKFKERLTKSLILFSCTLFLVIALIGYLDNWSLTCGCFGRFSFGRFDELMIFRNLLLVLMALSIRFEMRNFKNLVQKEPIANNNK